MALVRETQRGTCWQVRQADHCVAPAGGTRPGTIPLEKPTCRSASDADWGRAQSDLSFVDDLT
eukprot:9402376-Pyramimonas_sp.AAC.1